MHVGTCDNNFENPCKGVDRWGLGGASAPPLFEQ